MKRTTTAILIVSALAAGGCATTGAPNAEPAARPEITARAEWGAEAPVLPMRRHRPTRITIHHTATRQDAERGLEDKLRALQAFSQNPGELASGQKKPRWADVPYHYYIDVHGRIAEARDVRYAGDTNTEYDPAGHLLVVLEGNFEVEAVRPAQWDALERLVAWLAERWSVPAGRIESHRDHADTACPGAALYAELPALRTAVSEASGGGR